ncbi:Signal peptide peptidase-like 3 [Hypsibius exemplaris]|uniref:Signal peptide peptidase-like 3 n=1 Tax=Hypsibius exemplaris TaxID=2072580 RepID=A0A1W0XD89_HYPEX|nr:Signal peptide peptidase-like 3 [Hypsibius exemplaris]
MASDFDWVYTLMDSSRVSTFLISILLIVYGSFRSLNLEQQSASSTEADKKNEKSADSSAGSSHTDVDAFQAMCLPVGASISLLVMFFFFDSMQAIFAGCTAIIASIALAFLLLPMCQYFMRPCTNGAYNSYPISRFCGRFSAPELVSFGLSVTIVFIWTLTGHWLLMDALGMGLCVAFIALVRLPSLKVSTLLLTGLLLYDVFWVFFSSYIFNSNVMVRVATRTANNPMRALARQFNIDNNAINEAPKLSLPGKLVFPSMKTSGQYSMLGLGDIVMPGLLLCFVLRFDAHKKLQLKNSDAGIPGPVGSLEKVRYFHCALIGYFLGLLSATVSSEFFKAAQPALLYLVPFTLLPLLLMAYIKGDLRRMWTGFPDGLLSSATVSPVKLIDV